MPSCRRGAGVKEAMYDSYQLDPQEVSRSAHDTPDHISPYVGAEPAHLRQKRLAYRSQPASTVVISSLVNSQKYQISLRDLRLPPKEPENSKPSLAYMVITSFLGHRPTVLLRIFIHQ